MIVSLPYPCLQIRVLIKINFLISLPKHLKHMLWILKRMVSMNPFFGHPNMFKLIGYLANAPFVSLTENNVHPE